MKPMTMRQRMQAFVHGREHDRVPFVQYDGIAAPNTEVWDLIGRENMGLLRWTAVHGLATPNCRMSLERVRQDGKRGVRTTLLTPAGSLTELKFYEPTFGTAATHEHFIKSPADYPIFMAYLRDIVVSEQVAGFLQAQAELGEDGLPHTAVMRTPFQQLWIQYVSLTDLCLHLVDRPDLVQETIDLLTGLNLKIYEVVRGVAARMPLDYVDIGDNITAPVIGERYFRQYCLPLYQRLVEMLAEYDVKVFCHADGDLKPLWAAIRETGIHGLDSFSPPPDNDTSVTDARREWPQMRLGLNFPSSVHLRDAQGVYDAAREILQQGGASGRLQIQISENVPPGSWKTSYPAIVRAIADFTAEQGGHLCPKI